MSRRHRLGRRRDDWDNDLVVVVRWIKDDASQNEFFGKVIAAMNKPVSTR